MSDVYRPICITFFIGNGDGLFFAPQCAPLEWFLFIST